MKLLNFLIIKLTICLTTGILFGEYFPVNTDVITVLVIGGALVWTVVFLITDRTLNQSPFLGVITYVLLFLIGVLVLQFHTVTNQSKHYSNLVDLSVAQKVRIQVFKRLKPNRYHQKYLGKVISIATQKTEGTVLINSDTTQVIDIDTLLYVSAKFLEIKTPKNPHQFDYRHYMTRQQVYHQVFINSQNTLVLQSKQTSYGAANIIRQRINNTLQRHSISVENLSVINALFLGQRQTISQETYKSFTSSGAVHILAISGLHIGLLLLILRFCFKPFTYFKHGNLVVSITIILLLWTYAFIVGMSASVIRAVTMFSLFTIAMYSNRITNTYNTLVISAFLLLLFNPFYVFDIGFQLSYSAVFAIVWIKPQFDKLWTPNNYIFRKFWDVFSVTISAQLGIFPLLLFYFHQFPGLFFISNLVIIPLLGFLLGIGIIALIFAYFGWIPELLLDLFNNAISLLLNFVAFISDKEEFLLTGISFNRLNLVSSYLFIICLILLWKLFSYKRVVILLSSIVCFQLGLLLNKRTSQAENFIVFNQYKKTLIGHKIEQTFNYMSSSKEYPQSIDPYITNEFITTVHHDSLRNIFIYKNKKLLVVDKKSVYKTSFKPDIVVLTASPKINLNRLIQLLRPKQIVVDNNNYKSYIDRWEKTCLSERVLFYNINTNGAFVLK